MSSSPAARASGVVASADSASSRLRRESRYASPEQPTPSSSSGSFGSDVSIRAPRKTAVIAKAIGRAVSWAMISSPKFVFTVLRETISAAETDTMKAGTWATSPSPIVSRVNRLTVRENSHPYWTMPT